MGKARNLFSAFLLWGFYIFPGGEGLQFLISTSKSTYMYESENGSLTSVTSDSTGAVLSTDYDFVGGHIFYSPFATQQLIRVDLFEDKLKQEARTIAKTTGHVVSIALDWVHHRVYWSCHLEASVQRADLDGGHLSVLLHLNDTQGEDGARYHVTTVVSVNVDPFNNKLFMLAGNNTSRLTGHWVESSDLDGNSRNLVVPMTTEVDSMAVDFIKQRLYMKLGIGQIVYCNYTSCRERNILDVLIQPIFPIPNNGFNEDGLYTFEIPFKELEENETVYDIRIYSRRDGYKKSGEILELGYVKLMSLNQTALQVPEIKRIPSSKFKRTDKTTSTKPIGHLITENRTKFDNLRNITTKLNSKFFYVFQSTSETPVTTSASDGINSDTTIDIAEKSNNAPFYNGSIIDTNTNKQSYIAGVDREILVLLIYMVVSIIVLMLMLHERRKRFKFDLEALQT